MGDGWAWLSLSALISDLPSEEIQAMLPGSTASHLNPHLAAVEFKGRGEGTSLQELLDELAEYLESHVSELPGLLAGAEFQLRLGWSPLTPQECVAIPSGVIAALALLRADVMIDTYEVTEKMADPTQDG